MSEEFEALLVERKAVKYWRTEYLRARGVLERLLEANDDEEDWSEAEALLNRQQEQIPPQREGDYL